MINVLKKSAAAMAAACTVLACSGGMGLDRVVKYNGGKFNYNSSKVK